MFYRRPIERFLFILRQPIDFGLKGGLRYSASEPMLLVYPAE
jgi:hypothetical protein